MCDGCEVNQKYYRYAIEPTKEDLILDSLCIPTQTQIREKMGSKLADVFFESLSLEARLVLGLENPLTGPDEIWVNPKARLRNKVHCEPFPEPQNLYRKALTHEGVLALGEVYNKIHTENIRNETEEKFTDNKSELYEKFNKLLIEELQKAKNEGEEHCKQVVGTLMEHFDRCFAELAEECKIRMRNECLRRLHNEKTELAAFMLDQLQQEVERRDEEMCNEFFQTLNGELNAQATKFISQIDAERQVAYDVFDDIVEKYEKKLVELRNEMEVTCMVEVCRAVTEMKRRYTREMEIDKRRSTVYRQPSNVDHLKARNQILLQMATERAQRIAEYEKKMKELIQEFQKFVNFALKAVPGQAQYLLSAEKMAMDKFYEDSLLNPEEYEEFKNCLAKIASKKKIRMSTISGRLTLDDTIDDGPAAVEEKKQKKEREYGFNYYKFKYMLLNKFVKGLNFDAVEKLEVKTGPEKWSKKFASVEQCPLDEEIVEEVGKFKEALVIEGERAVEHFKPLENFLDSRMNVIIQMCKNDPDMVRLFLGTSGEERRQSSKGQK